jgi:hypothetical protein
MSDKSHSRNVAPKAPAIVEAVTKLPDQTGPGSENATTGPSDLPASEMVMIASHPDRDVDWLGPGWIGAGKVTIFDGDPGPGKSAVLLDIAARVSSGRELPGSARAQPGQVIIMMAEDSLEDTVRPRLVAAGADLTRCHSLASVGAKPLARPPRFPEDLPILEARVRQSQARLLIVDPLVAFLGHEVDSYRDQHVRTCLHRLISLCERHRFTGYGIGFEDGSGFGDGEVVLVRLERLTGVLHTLRRIGFQPVRSATDRLKAYPTEVCAPLCKPL